MSTRDNHFNIVFCELLAIGQTVITDSFWLILTHYPIAHLIVLARESTLKEAGL